MAVYQGIPLNSAIIIRHTPKDDRATDMAQAAGAVPMGMAKRGIDYIGRFGRFKENGDIDRTMTRQDKGLRDSAEARFAASRGLDYISRTGTFSKKGAERQEDASLWGQNGPVNRKGVEEQMVLDGGAFIDSILTVKREHADALGLNSKEAFQRLLRSTWTQSVSKWGLIEDSADIRWVAAYHTDAEKSLHCHIYTWSARGEIEPGATVSREGTRLGKEVVLTEAYSKIRSERDRRASYLRDLRIQQVKVQLGMPIEPERKQRLDDRALEAGYKERLSLTRDLSDDAKLKVAALSAKMARELEGEQGLAARNYRAQATARDLVEVIEKESPACARLKKEAERHIQAKADLKGYPNEGSEREGFSKREEEQQLKRICNALVHEAMPRETKERPLREDLRYLDMRKVEGFGNVTVGQKIAKVNQSGDALEVRVPGRRGAKAFSVALPIAETAVINQGKAHLAAIEEQRSYAVLGTDTFASGAQLIERLGRADMVMINRMNPPERPKSSKPPRLSDWERISRSAVKHGMEPKAVRHAERTATALTASLRGRRFTSVSDLSPRDRQRAEELAKLVVEGSPRIQETLHDQAELLSRESDRDVKECFELVSARAVEGTRDEICRSAAKGRLAPVQNDGPEYDRGPGLFDTLGGIAEALVCDGGGAGKRRASVSRLKTVEQEHSPERPRR